MSLTALVTGCSSGIGLTLCQTLLNEGWNVIGLSRRSPDIQHPQFEHRAVDLTDRDAIPAALAGIESLDALIHAAGLLRVGPHTEMSLSDGEAMWRLHLDAAASLCQTLSNKLPNGGRIVLIGSRVATGAKNKSLYAASKAALVGFSRSLAMELAERAITVNIVAPAATDTPMLQDPNRQGTAPQLPPFGRLVQPSEIAGTVMFLLSPSAAAMTGQQLVVCAGSSL